MQTGFSFFATRRFLPLFGTQFMGAFNDNLLRTGVVVLISYYGLQFAGLPAEQLVNLAAGIFILPFFLFSATAGKLSECVDKARIARMKHAAWLRSPPYAHACGYRAIAVSWLKSPCYTIPWCIVPPNCAHKLCLNYLSNVTRYDAHNAFYSYWQPRVPTHADEWGLKTIPTPRPTG